MVTNRDVRLDLKTRKSLTNFYLFHKKRGGGVSTFRVGGVGEGVREEGRGKKLNCN